jgi:hypothetical protein
MSIEFHRSPTKLADVRRTDEFGSHLSLHKKPMRLSRLASSFMTMSSQQAGATAAPVTSLDLVGAKGEFKRSVAAWRNWIKDGTCQVFFASRDDDSLDEVTHFASDSCRRRDGRVSSR